MPAINYIIVLLFIKFLQWFTRFKDSEEMKICVSKDVIIA